MKRTFSALVISGALLCTLAVPGMAAEAEGQPGASAAASAPQAQTLPASVLYFGQVTQVVRDEAGTVTRLVLSSERYGEYIMNISSDTVWIDSGNRTASDPADLKEGERLCVPQPHFHPLPSAPVRSLCGGPEYPSGYLLRPVPCGGGDHRGEDGGLIVTTDNGGLLIYLDGDTQTVRYAGGSAALEDLKAGDRIMAWYQAVALSYPGQTHADGLMLLPSEKEEPSSVLPENGTALDLVLEGDMVLPVTGLVENGTAMVPVAAVAQALGYQVIYTPAKMERVTGSPWRAISSLSR